MLAFANTQGEILKPLKQKTRYGLHPMFGLIPVEQLAERLRRRHVAGVKSAKMNWLCQFDVAGENISNIEGCKSVVQSEGNSKHA